MNACQAVLGPDVLQHFHLSQTERKKEKNMYFRPVLLVHWVGQNLIPF